MGTELFRQLIDIARREKLDKVVSAVLVENYDMLAICRKLGFQLHADIEDGTIQAELKL
jgi:RimJ/RimL family protein N-acetyltransferase